MLEKENGRTFQRERYLYLACNDRNYFFMSEEHKRYTFAKRCVRSHISFGQYLYQMLALSYTDKLKVFRWVLIVHSCS